MTTGTNLQLTYNEDTDSWSYQNVDYEYPSSGGNSWSGFTSSDPDFEYAPTEQDTSPDPDDDPCPAGYIYDNELKQCVPDPNYRAPAYYGDPQGGGGDDNQGAEFIDFDASTPEGRKAMFEHGQENKYFGTDTSKGGAYEFLGPPKAPNLGFMTPVAQFGENRQYNRYINELNKLNNQRLAEGKPAVLAQAIGFFGLAPGFKDWGNKTMAIHSPNLTTGFQGPYRTETTDRNIGGVNVDSLERELRKEKLRKAKADADKAEAQANEVVNNTGSDSSGDGGTTTGGSNIIGTSQSGNTTVTLKKKPKKPIKKPPTGTQQNQPGSVPNPHTQTGFSGGQSYGTSYAVGSPSPHGNNAPKKSKNTFKGK